MNCGPKVVRGRRKGPRVRHGRLSVEVVVGTELVWAMLCATTHLGGVQAACRQGAEELLVVRQQGLGDDIGAPAHGQGVESASSLWSHVVQSAGLFGLEHC